MQSTPLINNSSNNANTECKINSKNVWEQHFFPNTKLNFAENLLLNKNNNDTAIIFWSEDNIKQKMTYKELNNQVMSLAKTLKYEMNIKPNDVIIGFIPNTHYAVIAMLATMSIGAI